MRSTGSGLLSQRHQAEEEVQAPSGHDLSVLQALAGEMNSESIAFQGIKRKLGLHQETLSRSLHRLERDGYVEKIGHSYRLSIKGQSLILDSRSVAVNLRDASLSYPLRVLTAILPQDFEISLLADALEHKWFGNLRWYGLSQTEESFALTWITRDGSQKLTATIGEGTLSIESESQGKNQSAEAVKEAYQLFDHIMKTLKGIDSSSSSVRIGYAG